MTSLLKGFDKGFYKALFKYESCVFFSIYYKQMKPLKALIFLMEGFLMRKKIKNGNLFLVYFSKKANFEIQIF